MTPDQLFEQLSASVGPNYAAEMVRIRFPSWGDEPRDEQPKRDKLDATGEGRAWRRNITDGSIRLHKALWDHHPRIMVKLGAVVP